MSRMTRSYDELSQLHTFKERFDYLKLDGSVGQKTFGVDRWLNQRFYRENPDWKHVRDMVIIRDCGCDLGIPGRDIYDHIIVHHMNPIDVHDILSVTQSLLNPQFLICVTHQTHNALHYGNDKFLIDSFFVVRKPNDMCPWK